MPTYSIGALHPKQLSRFLANFMIPPTVGVRMDTARVWSPCNNSRAAFFMMGSKIRKRGCRNGQERGLKMVSFCMHKRDGQWHSRVRPDGLENTQNGL